MLKNWAQVENHWQFPATFSTHVARVAAPVPWRCQADPRETETSALLHPLKSISGPHDILLAIVELVQHSGKAFIDRIPSNFTPRFAAVEWGSLTEYLGDTS